MGRRRPPHGSTISHNSHRWQAPRVKTVADDFADIRGGKDEPRRTTSWPHTLVKSRTHIWFLTHAQAAANNLTYRRWANEEPHGAPSGSNDLGNLYTAIGRKPHVNIVAGDLAKRRLAKGEPQGGSTMAQRLGQATHHSHTASRPQERRWRLNRLTLSQRRAPHGPTTWEADTSRYDTRVLQGRGWQLDRTAGYRAVGSRAVGRSTVRVIGRRMFGLSAARALRRLGAAALGHSGVRVFLVVCATKHSGNRRVP